MRTTLELEDDVIHAAKQLARQRGATLGEVVPQLIRRGLETKDPPRMRNGVPLFVPKPGAPKPDLSLVNRLRDEYIALDINVLIAYRPRRATLGARARYAKVHASNEPRRRIDAGFARSRHRLLTYAVPGGEYNYSALR